MAGRVQVAISADGTEIVGRVRGQGPPLVLVHGALGDGGLPTRRWCPTLPTGSPATRRARGRGLSGDNPDHSPPRLEEDVTALVDSIGEPVCGGLVRRWRVGAGFGCLTPWRPLPSTSPA